jgi:flagellin-specific chaperone FliS
MKEIEQEIIRRALEIELKADDGDDEAAHSREDALYQYFIEQISNGEIKTIEEARQLAKRVLFTKELTFSRWYA